MTNAIKVGDVVAWTDVPVGALVREEPRARDAGVVLYSLRIGDWYRVVHNAMGWREWAPRRPWSEVLNLPAWCIGEHVTIIALGLTGQETAADLRRLAEVFEVREALDALLTCPHCDNEEPTTEVFEDGTVSQPWCTECDSEMGDPGLADEAERLYAAGWRPGMTAEDAVRLLREAGAK